MEETRWSGGRHIVSAGIDVAVSGKPLLQVEALSKRFGGVRALNDVSFALHAGEILGLIGPNGSGKSTCVNLLSGTLPPTSGRVLFDGVALAGLPVDAVVRRGLIRTFQATQIFPEYSVIENALVGCHARYRQAASAAVFGLAGARREEAEMRQAALAALAIVGLEQRGDVLAGTLSVADQRLLMIAVALASRPKLILLDEPAAGMVAAERRALSAIIRGLPRHGISVLVIEHHMGLIMEVCDRIVVLNFGEKIAEGTGAEIRANQSVIDAYLGRRDHA